MTLASVPRYDPDRIDERDGHAVVIGASMAGLLAARVLTDRYESVTVLDRDLLPDEALARRGLAQATQPHALLEAGRATIEDLLPGFEEGLLEAGGVVADVATDIDFYAEGGFLSPPPASMPMYCATRPLFDLIVRRRLADVEGVSLRAPCSFVEYLAPDPSIVEGVVIREAGEVIELAADLVVDATGRSSRTPAWLDAHGYDRPHLEEVRVDLAYSTVVVERPPADRRVILVPASHPHSRGGVVVPVEGDRWIVNAHGFHGDHPPTRTEKFEAFGDFAAGLPIPDVRDILDSYTLADDRIHHYPIPSSRRYRYGELDRFPEGLLVIGDAIASFNPIYAQGISVAALEALSLHHCLADGDTDLARRFFARAEEVVDLAWTMAVGPDFAFPETEGPKPRGSALVERYVARLTRKAHRDPELTDALYRVMRFERPPTTLFRPGVLWRVLKPSVRGADRSSGRVRSGDTTPESGGSRT